MNNRFDELTKGLAQSVTRRQAFKKFGLGLAGMALAAFGLAHKAGAAQHLQGYCQVRITSLVGGSKVYTGTCVDPKRCVSVASADCPANGTVQGDASANKLGCGGLLRPYDSSMRCSMAI